MAGGTKFVPSHQFKTKGKEEPASRWLNQNQKSESRCPTTPVATYVCVPVSVQGSSKTEIKVEPPHPVGK